MNNIIDWIKSTFGFSEEFQSNVFATLIAVLFLWLIRKIILVIVSRNTEDIRTRYQWRKGTIYLEFVFAVFIMGNIWFKGFSSISTYLGLLSAGIAIALQDLLVNLAGWAFILWRRPFAVGDRIQVGDSKGDVIDQRIFMFSLMEIGNWVDAEQSTGRVIHIPNGKVFRDVLANYSTGFQYIWNEIPVLVTFESNWEKAKKILLVIAEHRCTHLTKEAEDKIKKASQKMMIFFTKLSPIVYTSVKDSGVMLTIRLLTEPRNRRTGEQEIWEDILREFAKHDDIDFAYPSQRYYLNYIEGKKGTKPEISDGPGLVQE